MNELNEFWPRVIMGCGAVISGILLLSIINQYKKKFSNTPLVNLDEEKQPPTN
tara:strand:- start:457 stop:615 length:159 start_codon:yes stop_codon:yes gene_type:complete